MEPIVLNEFGETLLEYPESKTADDKRIIRFIDGRIVGDCIGVHDLCRGWVDIKPVSKTHNALVCRNCSLRIVVSVEVDTYGKLRQWCEFNIQHMGLSERVKRENFLAILQGTKVSPPTSAEIVEAADKERERIRKIIGR